MDSKTISKKELSARLEAYVDEYNRSNPAPGAPRYESLFSKAEEYYYQRRPHYYEALNRCFDSDRNLAFVDELWQRFTKSYPQPKIDPLNAWIEHDEDNDDCKYVELYMKGQYCGATQSTAGQDINDNNELIVCHPSAVYYALARTVGMPEEEIYDSFTWGDSLDITFYLRYLIKDICRYFFQKNFGSLSKLEKTIKIKHPSGYSDSNLRKLILEDQIITHTQFAVLAEALNIPSKYVDFCQYRIAEYAERNAYFFGYNDALMDLEMEPEEFLDAYLIPSLAERLPMYKVFDLFENAAKLYAPPEDYFNPYKWNDKEAIFRKFYNNKGFSFEPFTGDEDIPENLQQAWLLNFAKMYITLPNGQKKLIDTDQYLKAVDKASDYALYLLWKKTGGPERAKNEDSE